MSKTNWVSIRNELKAELLSVPGIKIVHGFPRIVKDDTIVRWLKLMIDQSEINAWTILRESQQVEYLTGGDVFVGIDILLLGMLEHSESKNSQDVFDEVVDNVVEKFWKNFNLAGTVTIQGPAQIRLEELRQVADKVVHTAEVTIKARKRIYTGSSQ